RNMPLWFVAIPAVFMLILPAWALCYQLFHRSLGAENSWLSQGDWVLAGFAIVTLAVEIWMIVEAVRVWPHVKGVLEEKA
ncbi:MAG: carbon starvation CstA family protein, partial [Luteolibacter sp.]